MEIKPVDQTVKQLLEGDFYRVPRFQRPYSWDRENVEEFWNDAIVADVPHYFIGSFVVYKTGDQYGPLLVVDGQQRLTTITLLLAAVRDALDAASLTALANGVQQLIERQDINSDLRFVLQTETSYPYLQEHIQKHGAPVVQPDLGEEEEALKLAYEFLKGQLEKEIRSINKTAGLTADQKKKKVQAYLQRVRNQVLRLQLILIRLTKEDDAYLIFETLNTRGKDLTVADLVKNHLARLLRPKNKGVDIARDRWGELLDVFDSSKAEIDANKFLHHTWLSRNQYIGEKELFKEIRKSINGSNAQTFLGQLLKDASVYRTIFEPEWHKWTKQESELLISLKALQVFRVVQPAPMLLAIVRAYLAKELKLKQTRQVLSLMERFHFQFTAMTAQRTGGGTGQMYASSARALWEAKSADNRAQVLKEFGKKLAERVPSEAEFTAGFLRLNFHNTKQRSLLRYVLMRVDEHFRTIGGPPDYDKMSIEHIAPQNPPSGSPLSSVADLGNLIFVPEALNNEALGNKPFSAKKLVMQNAGVPMDPILSAATSWGDAEIQARGELLARRAYEKIFAL